MGYLIGPPFHFGKGGPGGWIIIDEPELHLAEDVVVPDLAGWRRERMPVIGTQAFFELPPDWVCEFLSRSTAVYDRSEKLPIYARAGIKHVWLVNALTRTLEIMRLHEGQWLLVGIHRGDLRIRAEPFDAIELDLSVLWADVPPPPPPRGSRAAEPAADYGADL